MLHFGISRLFSTRQLFIGYDKCWTEVKRSTSWQFFRRLLVLSAPGLCLHWFIVTAYCNLHGRRKGGPWPLDFQNFNKNRLFSYFRVGKNNFTTFGPPRKILEKSSSGPSWKEILPTPMLTLILPFRFILTCLIPVARNLSGFLFSIFSKSAWKCDKGFFNQVPVLCQLLTFKYEFFTPTIS